MVAPAEAIAPQLREALTKAGIPLSVLRSFDAPPAELLEDGDALRDRIMATVSDLLAKAIDHVHSSESVSQLFEMLPDD